MVFTSSLSERYPIVGNISFEFCELIGILLKGRKEITISQPKVWPKHNSRGHNAVGMQLWVEANCKKREKTAWFLL